MLSTEEFDEYARFCDCHTFLESPLQKLSIVLKETDLINYYMKVTQVKLYYVVLYDIKFYMLNDTELNALADWIEMHLKND